MAIRDGFIIPNASTYAPDFQTSQPDQGDFVILGNSRYGVISGCKITLAGSTVSMGITVPNILVVNGVIYANLGERSATLASQGTLPRFDLVCHDTNSPALLTVATGTASSNPVFPDVTPTMTVLAAVFVPASTSSTNLRLIDKRNILQASVTGYNEPVMLANYNSSNGSSYAKVSIDGDGKITWGSGTAVEDASIYRSSTGTVTITNSVATPSIAITNTATVAGKKVVTAETIDWGDTLPGTGQTGDIFVDTDDGTISIRKGDAWVTVDTALPSGTIIMSAVTEDKMDGWLPLKGGDYLASAAGNLPGLFPSWLDKEYPTNSDARIYLPDMTGLLPIGGPVVNNHPTKGTVINKIDNKGTMSYSLTQANIPLHTHQNATDTKTLVGGEHGHSGTVAGNGSHTHDIVGSTHNHFSSDQSYPIVRSDYDVSTQQGDIPTGYIPKWNAGISSVNNIWVREASTNRTSIPDPIMYTQSANHTHTVSIAAAAGHDHGLPTHTTYGQSPAAAITMTPPSFALLFYIKK